MPEFARVDIREILGVTPVFVGTRVRAQRAHSNDIDASCLCSYMKLHSPT